MSSVFSPDDDHVRRGEGQVNGFAPDKAMASAASHGLPRGPAGSARGRRRLPPKLYRIGEVVAYADVSRQTIHNYTSMGLLREREWTAGGHRLYDESVFDRLDKVAEMKAQNRSMEDIREYFERIDASAASSQRA